MIEWNDNAKAAVRAFADYIGQTKKCHRYLESFASKKTVADAVECIDKQVLSHEWDVILYDGDSYYPVSDNYAKKWVHQIICTREQFEAYVKEQEGEKWTHTIKATKEKCRITEGPNNSGQVFIKTEVGLWDCLYIEQLKLIKPTISRSDENALRAFAVWYENETDCESLLDEYLAKHEVIEGQSND